MSPTINLGKKKKPEKTVSSKRLIAFYASTRWRKLRAYKLSQDPLCENCLKENRTTPAKEVHHITSVDPNNIDPEVCYDYDNLQSLCVPCHRKIQSIT